RGPGDQQPDIDPVGGGVLEDLIEPRGGREVGVGDPDPLGAEAEEEVEDPPGAAVAGPGRDDPDGGRPGRGDIPLHLEPVVRIDTARGDPDVLEGVVHRPRRRPLDQEPGVPPWQPLPGGVAGPLIADAEPAGDGPVAIDHQQLPVVASDDGHRVEEPRATEAADLDAGLAEATPEGGAGADRPEPVVED